MLLTTAELSARSKAEFSLVIHPVKSTVKVGSAVETEVRTTNLTNHDVVQVGPVSYDVRRDGMSVAETELAKKLKQPSPPCKAGQLCIDTVSYVPTIEPLKPRQTTTETVSVSRLRDMQQLRKYTIYTPLFRPL